MRAVQVREPNAPLELVERDMPEPGPLQVRIKVEACGICHSDSFVRPSLPANGWNGTERIRDFVTQGIQSGLTAILPLPRNEMARPQSK